MYEIINNVHLKVKEYNGQRVVTFKDIDMVHGRPEGTARKRFNYHHDNFIEGEDFYKITPSEFRTAIGEMDKRQQNDIILLTESGYLMIVKSLTDKLAWSVQRELVKTYFRARHMETFYNETILKILENQEEIKRRQDRFEKYVRRRFNLIHRQNKNIRELFSETLSENNQAMFPAFIYIRQEITDRHNEIVRIVKNILSDHTEK